MNTNIAIKGHKTRGDEVIELLEMLGGENIGCFNGTATGLYYFIENDKILGCAGVPCNYIIFTLEKFLEKFPYKVLDKVIVKGLSEYPKIIHYMKWFDGNVHYSFDDETWFHPSALQLYKEETMEESVYAYNEINCYHQDFADKVQIRLGEDYKIEVEDGKTYVVRKKFQYPETFKDCCFIIHEYPTQPSITGYKHELLHNLRKLLICRDAYWVIAGKELGLEKSWEPDWDNYDDTKYCIYATENIISLDLFGVDNKILAFPTEKMRNAFYKNFKELIEACKVFL